MLRWSLAVEMPVEEAASANTKVRQDRPWPFEFWTIFCSSCMLNYVLAIKIPSVFCIFITNIYFYTVLLHDRHVKPL